MNCDHCPLGPGAPCPGLRARRLCDLIDPAHPEYRPGYVASILELAGASPVAADPAPAEGRPSASAALALARAMRACDFRSTDPSCGCSGGRCALRGGEDVSHLDCFPCLERYP